MVKYRISQECKTVNATKLNIDDLLGRATILIDMESIAKTLRGKTVMVTGAAGSIGSEIVRQLGDFEIGKLLLCDMAESPLHQLGLDVKYAFPDLDFDLIICDVRNYDKMNYIFGLYKPQYIYHAAAYKHVPLMEEYPCEAVLANVLGTKIVSNLAITYHAECFVMISTDKAVNPSNVMGASKRIAEIYVQSLSEWLRTQKNTSVVTRFITTRFGNVLDSSGSVVPIFKKQIEQGGPLTVTHPEVTRYFMTIPEACSLVLEAGSLGKGGEIFIFDMGAPIKIKELAEEMIRLSGLEPYKDIDIVYTGLRQGEKLYEELLYDKENTKPTKNEKIMVGKNYARDLEEIEDKVSRLINLAHHFKPLDVVKAMKEIIPEYVSVG